MADTVDTGLLPRTYFKAPRVPFDFRALALAMLGYLVYWAGSLVLNEVFRDASHPVLKEPNIVGSFLATAFTIFRDIPFIGDVIGWFLGTVFAFGSLPSQGALESYGFWRILSGGVWIFFVWSFFGQAIHRITSLRIARDEGLSFVQALTFSARNWVTVILAPVIVGLTIGFFYGCNALAGLAMSIPFAGQILALILIPLMLISSLLILLIALGGVFGLPLIGAAAAWERNGSLDAISRAFSYIFARPLQFFWNYFLIFLFVGVILLVGSWFVTVMTKSTDAGIISTRLSMLVDPPKRTDVEEFRALETDLQTDFGNLEDPKSTGFRNGRDTDGSPFVKHWDSVGVAGWSYGLTAILLWLAINLVWIGVFGYAIYWFLGATTSVYADLRADVDGTEEDEIYLEDEEEDFDALAEAVGEAERAAEEAPAPASEAVTEPAPSADAPADDAPEGETPPPEDDKPSGSFGVS